MRLMCPPFLQGTGHGTCRACFDLPSVLRLGRRRGRGPHRAVRLQPRRGGGAWPSG